MQSFLSADTNQDEFTAFDGWRAKLMSTNLLEWRDALPTAIADPSEAADHPPLIRALDRVRQYSRLDGTIAPWLGLPFAIRDQGLSTGPLPCPFVPIRPQANSTIDAPIRSRLSATV